MSLLIRTRPFLVVAVMLAAMWIVGSFWEAPFHVDEVGVTRLFGEAFNWAFIPPRMLVLFLSLWDAVPIVLALWIAVAAYISAFVLLDRVVTRWARRLHHEAP